MPDDLRTLTLELHCPIPVGHRVEVYHLREERFLSTWDRHAVHDRTTGVWYGAGREQVEALREGRVPASMRLEETVVGEVQSAVCCSTRRENVPYETFLEVKVVETFGRGAWPTPGR